MKSGRSARLSEALAAVTHLDQALADRRLLRSRGAIRLATSVVLDQLSRLSDDDVVALDRRVRSWSQYTHWGHGANLPGGFVAPEPETVRAAAAAASFSRSGFVREQACRGLAGFLPWSFRLLAIRTGDWVPQVRAAALDGVREGGVTEMVEHLGLVSHLIDERSRSRELQDLVERKLRTPSGLSALAQERSHDNDIGTRRAAWSLLMSWEPDASRGDLADAAGDADSWVRWWAARHAASDDVPRNVRLAVSARLRRDRVGRLRAQGMQIAVEDGAVDNAELLAALADESAAMRGVVQTRLRADGVDLAKIYRSRVADAPAPGDLLGLGETGDKQDAERLAAYLRSGSGPHRRAALIATVALLDNDAIPIAGGMLHDPSPRVARTAAACLRRRRLPAELVRELEAQAVESPLVASRQRAVSLLRNDSWRWLLAVLRNLPTTGPGMSAFLGTELAEWRKRSARISIGPVPSNADEIRHRAALVSEDFGRVVEFVIRTSRAPI